MDGGHEEGMEVSSILGDEPDHVVVVDVYPGRVERRNGSARVEEESGHEQDRQGQPRRAGPAPQAFSECDGPENVESRECRRQIAVDVTLDTDQDDEKRIEGEGEQLESPTKLSVTGDVHTGADTGKE